MSCDRCHGIGLHGPVDAPRLCDCYAGELRELCRAIDEHLPAIPGKPSDRDRPIEWWVERVKAAGLRRES